MIWDGLDWFDGGPKMKGGLTGYIEGNEKRLIQTYAVASWTVMYIKAVWIAIKRA